MTEPSKAARRPAAGKTLTGLDALFLYLESAGTPMHVASVMILQRPRGRRHFAQSLRDHLIARLAPLPMLRWVLEESPMGLAHPRWRDGGEIDWQAHLGVSKLSAGRSAAGLASRLASLHAAPLERDRPLWRIEIIDGLPDGQLALYLKSHHALVDGQAGVMLTRALVDVGAGSAPAAAAADAPPPGDARARRSALRGSVAQLGQMLRGLPQGVRQLGQGVAKGDWLERLRDSVWLAPKTPFNRTIGDARRVGLVSLPLGELKRCAKGFECSLNDVVMCLVADALRADLARRRCLPDEPLVAAMPVSLREAGKQQGNEVSMVQCPLATDIADPRQRLQAIRAATRTIKGRVAAFRGLIPTDFPGLGAPLWVSGLSQLWQRGRLSERLPALANLVVSNVPGPPIPLQMGGAPILHWYPLSIVTHGLGLNVTLLSYADSMEVGVVSAPECLARPEVLCRGIERGLGRLLKALPA